MSKAVAVANTGRPSGLPGIVLGIGMGGFVDGILLHQVLQWHHLVCETPDCAPTSIVSLSQATLLDGLFHSGTWIVTLIGAFLVFNAARRGVLGSTVNFIGSLLAGWGIFNLVEGIVNHHLLQIHHVRPGPDQALWDYGFLAVSVGLLVLGRWLIQKKSAYA